MVSKLEIDKKIVAELRDNLNPDDESKLKFVKHLLLTPNFSQKTELSEMLIEQSEKIGYSLFKQMLRV